MNFERDYLSLLKLLNIHPLNKETNWYVGTGPPSSGKSTSLRRLQEEGYKVNPDISREYIISLKKRGVLFDKETLYSMETQKILFFLMTNDALNLDRSEMIIHDYSLPDNIAFLKLGNLPVPDEIRRSAEIFRFKKVFIFEPLELVQDGVRTEDRDDQEQLFHILKETYFTLGYDPVIVRSDTINNRHRFLIKHLPDVPDF
ncbi:MAG: ATP-binding protein [Acidobacteriota bacterium]